MRRWSEVADQIAVTKRKTEKVATLARYLRSLDETELPIAILFFSGRPVPRSERQTLGIGWRTIVSVAEAVAQASPGALMEAYQRSSDPGEAVEDLLRDGGHVAISPEPSLADVAAAFAAIAAARGAAAKGASFKALLERADPRTARYVVRILARETRIGLRDGHVEAAIAEAFDQPSSAVHAARMMTGDLAETAALARAGRLDEAVVQLFRPLTSMLASPIADEAEVFDRLGSPVWVEDKYDGIRAQLHKLGGEVRLYSRDLREVTEQFPEVVRAAADLPWDLIADGELLAWQDAAALPFQALQTRLGRKSPDTSIQQQIPVVFVAFDLLALGPGGGEPVESLIEQALRMRRARLDELNLQTRPGLGVSQLLDAATPQQLSGLFDAAQARGNEGLMVKDPDAVYSPGRRGMGWLKLKRPLATLDCVVVAVEEGHGKRHGLLSDYTFAVIDDRPGREGALATIGKAYTGLTDAEIASMTAWFVEHTLDELGRYRVVEPRIVVEIAFDVIQSSTRHNSGFALRFPRIVRLRPDKQPDEIDLLSTVARLHERLTSGGRYRTRVTAPDPVGTER